MSKRIPSVFFALCLAIAMALHVFAIAWLSPMFEPLATPQSLTVNTVRISLQTQPAAAVDPASVFIAPENIAGASSPEHADARQPRSSHDDLAQDGQSDGLIDGSLMPQGLGESLASGGAPVVTQVSEYNQRSVDVGVAESGVGLPPQRAQNIRAPLVLWLDHSTVNGQVFGPNDSGPVAPAAKKSAAAYYLEGWRRWVQNVGNSNLPAQVQNSVGAPVVEITLAASGVLVDAQIVQSSGVSRLDSTVLSILTVAGQYQPFPPALRAQTQQLVFQYEWRFNRL